MKISVIGMGYVGLVTASCLAALGHDIICHDVVREKVKMVNDGKVPFYEPDLEELIRKNRARGRLRTETDFQKAICGSEVTFICVGTPRREDGMADLLQVHSAIEQIDQALKRKKGYHLLVVKSTVPPGTTKLLATFLERGGSDNFGICMNPEFLREGTAVYDFMHPDRTVIGGRNAKDIEMLERVYRKLNAPVVKTDLETAEMIKYTSNAFLATKISFINEIAHICEKTNIDVYDVANGIGYDKRIGRAFLNAGVGWGGSCFGKDLSSLLFFSKATGYEPQLLSATVKVNEHLPAHMVNLAKERSSLKGKRVTVLGLSFKPETSDIRDAPSIKVIELLLKEGARVTAYDPEATGSAKGIFGKKIQFTHNAADALKDSECCFVMTEWSEFKKLDADDFKKLMKTPFVVDGRALYDPRVFKQKGVMYLGIGRPKL